MYDKRIKRQVMFLAMVPDHDELAKSAKRTLNLDLFLFKTKKQAVAWDFLGVLCELCEKHS